MCTSNGNSAGMHHSGRNASTVTPRHPPAPSLRETRPSTRPDGAARHRLLADDSSGR